ncbi:MAG: serine hydrolase [Bacteroidales bacterium]|nr:serine hydrolase [Bacteroidales bacterium]
MKKINLLMLMVLALLYSCNRPGTPQQFNHSVSPEKSGVTPEKVSALDSIMQSFVDGKKVNCAVGFVAKDGKVVYNKAFGYKNIEDKIPALKDDYYILYSQTKAVVTAALMILHDQGYFKLDDPVSKWLPDFPDKVLTEVNEDGTFLTEQVNNPCTFANLLSHSSGVGGGSVRQLKSILAKSDSTIKVGLGARYNTVKEQVEDAMKYPLGFQPGSQWNYNIGVDVAAYIIEVITGKPLKDYLQETIFSPLGMDGTAYYYTDKSLLPRFVTAYSNVDGELVPSRNNLDAIFKPTTYCAGTLGLHGPIEDYAKFCQMILNKGEFNGHRILKPETVETMTTLNRLPEINSGGDGFQFGIGFQLINNPASKFIPEMSDSCLRWGGAMGTEYLIDLENKLVILYYINIWGQTNTYNDYLRGVYALFE